MKWEREPVLGAAAPLLQWWRLWWQEKREQIGKTASDVIWLKRNIDSDHPKRSDTKLFKWFKKKKKVAFLCDLQPQSRCDELGLLAISSPVLASSFVLCRLGVPRRFMEVFSRSVHDTQSRTLCLKAMPSMQVGKELTWVTSWESTWHKRIVVGVRGATQVRKVSLYSQDQLQYCMLEA